MNPVHSPKPEHNHEHLEMQKIVENNQQFLKDEKLQGKEILDTKHLQEVEENREVDRIKEQKRKQKYLTSFTALPPQTPKDDLPLLPKVDPLERKDLPPIKPHHDLQA